MNRFATLLTALSLGLAVIACGGDPATDATDVTDEPELDAGSEVDAAPPDAEPSEVLSDLSDADWTALCMEVLTEDYNAGIQVAFSGCIEADCEASATAVEDCIDELTIEPSDCEPPEPKDPLRTCDAPVADLVACIDAAYLPSVTYPAATCETVDELPPINFDFATIPECDDLLAQCPDVFGE